MDRLVDFMLGDFMLWDGIALIGAAIILVVVGMSLQNRRLAVVLVGCIPAANIAIWATNYVLPEALSVTPFLSPVVTVGLLICVALLFVPWIGMDFA